MALTQAVMLGGLAFWRNPPGVAQQHNVFFIECLPAHPVDYGTHGVPHPCIEGGTAEKVSAMRIRAH